MPSAVAVVTQLIQQFDEAFSKRSWHGTNLSGSIRGLSAKQAVWRADRRGHSIADIVVHCAYWKYSVRRRLRGEKRGSFPLKGSNWFGLPDALTDVEWRGYVRLLKEQHTELRDAVASLSDHDLSRTPAGGKEPIGFLVRGVIAHDLYHAGQIQTIKGLHKRGGKR